MNEEIKRVFDAFDTLGTTVPCGLGMTAAQILKCIYGK